MPKVQVTCNICGESFSRRYSLNRHTKRKHSSAERKKPVSTTKRCNQCSADIPVDKRLCHLCTLSHRLESAETYTPKLKIVKSSFKNRIKTYIYENCDSTNLNVEDFLKSAEEVVIYELKQQLLQHKLFKFNVELFADYLKMAEDTEQYSIKSFNTKMVLVQSEDEIESNYKLMMEIIQTKTSEFQERDSGWTLSAITHLEINVNKYQPLSGASQYLKLPEKIQKKHACINVKNDDEFCFKWSIISALDPVVTHSNRPKSYGISNIKLTTIALKNGIKLEFGNLDFPLKVKDIKIFEELNPGVSVNVFGLEDDQVVGPLYCTKLEKAKHINLLLLEEDERSHYVWIKNISRLLGSQITKNSHKIFICNFCFINFHSEHQLLIHKEECNRIVTIMPSPENNIVEFKNVEREMEVPFVIYADFECLLQDIDTCSPNPSTSSTINVQEHIPCAFAYYIKCSFDDKLNKLEVYKGKDCADKFVKLLVADIKRIYNEVLMNPKTMENLDDEQLKSHFETNTCHICNKIIDNDCNKVRDHCHLTGRYKGPAHKNCNLRYRVPKFFPIFFHNFSGYDCHLFVKSLEKVEGDINLIPLNKELYVSLSKRIHVSEKKTVDLRFLDSFRFMSSSLDSLTQNLTTDDFHTVRNFFSSDEQFKLVTRKGILPYEYLNCWERLEETTLPPKEKFHSRLLMESCSDEDYQHAQRVWQQFNCENLWDYLQSYLITDVLLLTDVFENFRKICRKIYNLDPCHYYTAPGLSWDAMLKYTGIKIELLTDINMHSFIRRGIRGGITQCSHRHSIANNKYMDNCDSSKPSTYLMYLDANNLYGWAMSQQLPYGGFQWLEGIESIDIMKIPEESDVGYIFEVDLEYPQDLHDKHNDFPFCPENKITQRSKCCKLITDLTDKTKYIVHYKNLQQCVRHGLKIKQIHRCLQFKQSRWLKKYIDLNTHYRTLAKNTFEKNFFKLLNNAVYGKTMENVDKRKDVKLVMEWESRGKRLGARALIAKTNFHSAAHFTPNMVAIQLNRVKTCYNKPIYIGFTVLELSKWLMYDFHYEYMIPKYCDRLSLNYMDTDSLIYTIKTDDFYDDIRNDIDDRFDTSEYAIKNPYSLPLKNKKVVGLMKDENNGKIMREFIGLKAKMYSIDIINDKQIKKAKGVKRTVVNGLTLNDYRECLYKKKIFYRVMFTFKSKLHNIYTQQLNKIALSYFEDKRFIQPDGISTLAWGHYCIKKQEEDKEINEVDGNQ